MSSKWFQVTVILFPSLIAAPLYEYTTLKNQSAIHKNLSYFYMGALTNITTMNSFALVSW